MEAYVVPVPFASGNRDRLGIVDVLWQCHLPKPLSPYFNSTSILPSSHLPYLASPRSHLRFSLISHPISPDIPLNPPRAIIVTTSSRKDRLEGYLDVLAIELTADDVAAIDKAGIKGEKWAEGKAVFKSVAKGLVVGMAVLVVISRVMGRAF